VSCSRVRDTYGIQTGRYRQRDRQTDRQTSVAGALQGDVFEQLDPHLAGGPGPLGVLLHQHKVGVVAVQGVDGAVGQVLGLVHCRGVRLGKQSETTQHIDGRGGSGL